jgi:hypothetical protein
MGKTSKLNIAEHYRMQWDKAEIIHKEGKRTTRKEKQSVFATTKQIIS